MSATAAQQPHFCSYASGGYALRCSCAAPRCSTGICILCPLIAYVCLISVNNVWTFLVQLRFPNEFIRESCARVSNFTGLLSVQCGQIYTHERHKCGACSSTLCDKTPLEKPRAIYGGHTPFRKFGWDVLCILCVLSPSDSHLRGHFPYGRAGDVATLAIFSHQLSLGWFVGTQHYIVAHYEVRYNLQAKSIRPIFILIWPMPYESIFIINL